MRDDEPIYSRPSVPIVTFAGEPPGSKPVILKALAIDHSKIYVKWKAGLFPNAPLFSYVLKLQHQSREIFHIPVSEINLLGVIYCPAVL